MSSRKDGKEVYINGKRVIGVIEAARRLTERARLLGSDRVYSRDTIYRHYANGTLTPALETQAGNLYYEEDIDALPIRPHIGKRGKSRGNDEDDPREISVR